MGKRRCLLPRNCPMPRMLTLVVLVGLPCCALALRSLSVPELSANFIASPPLIQHTDAGCCGPQNDCSSKYPGYTCEMNGAKTPRGYVECPARCDTCCVPPLDLPVAVSGFFSAQNDKDCTAWAGLFADKFSVTDPFGSPPVTTKS